MSLRRVRRYSNEKSSSFRVPIGSEQSREGGNEVDSSSVLDGRNETVDVGGFLDEAHLISKPDKREEKSATDEGEKRREGEPRRTI